MDEHVDYREPATADEPVANADWLTEWMRQGGICVEGRDAYLERVQDVALRMTYGAIEGVDRE